MKKLILLPIIIALPATTFAFPDADKTEFKPYIDNMSAEKLISGYDDGTFRPNNSVSFAEALKIAINASENYSKIVQNPTNWFVPYNTFYTNNFAQFEKIFGTNDKISRDFAIYLTLRNLGITLTPEQTKNIANFPDIKATSLFAPYTAFAKYAGITSGYANGNFGPNNSVTRGEFTKMIWKSLRENKSDIMAKYAEITKNTTNSEILQSAKNWLNQVNGQYSNYSELANAANTRFGAGSDIAGTAMSLVSSGQFSYTYKRVTTTTPITNPTPSTGTTTTNPSNPTMDQVIEQTKQVETMAAYQNLYAL